MRIDYLLEPGGSLQGRLRVPGDKSISHRAVILASLADGVSHITGLLEGEDVLATIAAFRAMGVGIDGPVAGKLTIRGVGLHGLRAPAVPLDMGNSGTAMRLLSGVLAAQVFDSELTGDASLRRRPMRRVSDPLNAMGADIRAGARGCPPLAIRGGRRLHGIDYPMPVASAQVKSALLLAGLYASGTTSVTEPAPTRDHTERMLRAFGWAVEVEGRTARVGRAGGLRACDLEIPGDLSSAAFFLVGAAIAQASELVVENVGVNPTRTGVLELLRHMGATVDLSNRRETGQEPLADVRARSTHLRGIVIPREQVSLAIDEFPVLFVAAACAQGETVLDNAQELRVKESDRIAVMAQGLRALGADARETDDGMIVRGSALDGGEVDSHGDHRVAMAFAMAALAARNAITVRDCKNVDTSFPGFAQLAARAGLRIRVIKREE
jgi:3-phosphoshikimate 1-carboxyvinyltransferase